jgi:hypothetical protein
MLNFPHSWLDAGIKLLNPNFDARQFVKRSGVTVDWLQTRILGWAAQE